MIINTMQNQENYFDKFMKDLEQREAIERKRQSVTQQQQEYWEQRMALERSYREHAKQRVRYEK